jgi:hypothetical protein
MLVRQPNGQLQNNTTMGTTTRTDQTRANPGQENKALQLIHLKSKDKSKETKGLSIIMGTE